MSVALKDLLIRLFVIIGSVAFTLIVISIWRGQSLIEIIGNSWIGFVFLGLMLWGNYVRFLREARAKKAEING